MNNSWLLVLAIVATVDLAGRIGALCVLMNNGAVKTLSYKTWTLLCVFLNFAWVFYFLLGKKQK